MAKDKEDDFNPFEGLDAAIVLQECRVFHDREINVRKCTALLTKILYLMGKGERITKDDATNVFFGATKLLQSKDASLRRLVYLIFRDLSAIVSPEERIIVTATLVNGMRDSNEIYRAAAIRVLACIIDSAMFGGEIERKMKECVVDKSDVVASASLVAGKNLFERQTQNTDVIKRWVSEITSALQSRSATVQTQALSLLWTIRKHDRLAVSKLVGALIRTPLRSQSAQCLRLRLAGKVMEEEGVRDRSLYEFVEGCLRHKSEVVMLEAARVLCSISHLTHNDLVPALTVLQHFLSSPRLTTRFAAIRILNRVAMSHPNAVQPCNSDIEGLMTEQNRSIATLAITTLLKTATDTNVDHLMRQISGFMTDMADEFKIVVVQAMRSLCLRFPEKYPMFMGFLSRSLRDEGGKEFKFNIVQAMCDIVRAIPQAKEPGLMMLCEFIEDCEFNSLNVRVLALIGEEGGTLENPGQVLHFVFNRMVLEANPVRAAAVDAIAALGYSMKGDLRAQCIGLLRLCTQDEDGEVRDRALTHISLLSAAAESAATTTLLKPYGESMDWTELERELLAHCNGAENTAVYDIHAKETEFAKRPPKRTVATTGATAVGGAVDAGAAGKDASARTQTAGGSLATGGGAKAGGIANILAAVPELAVCGPLFKSTKPHEVTEPDSDYVVTCTKHIFAKHVVLHFTVTNTVETQQLESVVVECDLSGVEGLALESVVPAECLVANVPGSVFVVLTRGDALEGSVVNTLRFQVKEVDVATGEPNGQSYEDEYQLEDIAFAFPDLIRPTPVMDFRSTWEGMGAAHSPERIEVFALAHKKIPAAVQAIVETLGMKPFEDTHRVRDADAKRHTLLCSGTIFPDVAVMCIVNFAFGANDQIHVRVSVRATNAQACDRIVECVSS